MPTTFPMAIEFIKAISQFTAVTLGFELIWNWFQLNESFFAMHSVILFIAIFLESIVRFEKVLTSNISDSLQFNFRNQIGCFWIDMWKESWHHISDMHGKIERFQSNRQRSNGIFHPIYLHQPCFSLFFVLLKHSRQLHTASKWPDSKMSQIYIKSKSRCIFEMRTCTKLVWFGTNFM